MIVSRSLIMDHQSIPLTIGETLLKKSDDLVTLGVIFVSKTTIEKHLRSVSREASQRQGILRMSWLGEYSMIDRFFGDAVRALSCPFWSTVMQRGALLPIHTINYWTV